MVTPTGWNLSQPTTQNLIQNMPNNINVKTNKNRN